MSVTPEKTREEFDRLEVNRYTLIKIDRKGGDIDVLPQQG